MLWLIFPVKIYALNIVSQHARCTLSLILSSNDKSLISVFYDW
jgi:hypothetical protein